MRNATREIEIIVYKLKRRFGTSVRYYRLLKTNDVDFKTGKTTSLYDVYAIRRGVPLPSRKNRKFNYDLSFIAANKNFSYGGFYDKSERVFLFDLKDFPSGFEPNQSDNIEYNQRRYHVKDITLTEDGNSFLVLATNVEKYDLLNIPLTLTDNWSLTDGAIITSS